MRIVWNFVRSHFEKHRTRSPLAFAWWMGLEGLVVSMVLAAVLISSRAESRTDILNLTYVEGFLTLVVAAPLGESLIFQMLPIAVARWWRALLVWQVVFSTLLFAAAHFPAGIGSGVCAGIIGGFYFAFGYSHWAARSHWTAYWTTTFQHSLRNLVSFGIVVSAGGLFSAGDILESNASSGGECGISAWYFTSRSDGTVRFAIVFSGDSNAGRVMRPMTVDGSIRRNFQIDFAGRGRDFEYSAGRRTLTIDENSFDLSQGNTIVLTVKGDQYTSRQLDVVFDPERMQSEPFSVLHAICETMKAAEHQRDSPAEAEPQRVE